MATLTSALADLRARLDEASPRFWSDAELTVWLNEGCRAIARRAEVIQSFNTTVAGVAGIQSYALPTDVIRLHRVSFVPSGSTQNYPMKPSTDDAMDRVWGINPTQQASYPSFYTLWGTPGLPAGVSQLKMKVYPVPAQAGTFQIYYYRQPVAMVAGGDIAEIPAGWDDLLPLYAEHVALLKDKDDRWKEVKARFDEEIAYLIEVTRMWHDQQAPAMMNGMASYQPTWLYAFDE